VRLYAELAAAGAEFQTLFDQATACAQAAGLPQRVADAWALKAFWHGVHDELAALASCARHTLATAEAKNYFARVYAHLALAGALHWVGEYERSAAHFGPALSAARASGQAHLHLLAQRQLALAQAKEARHQRERGDVSPHSLRQAEFDLRAAITLTHELAPRNPAIYLHVFVAEMLTLQGEHSQALALLDEHLPLARSAHAWALVCIASMCRAQCLHKTGHLHEALAASDDSLAASTQHPDPDLQAQAHTTRGAILQALGRSDEAAVQSHLAHHQRQQHQALSDQHRHTLFTALAGL
jgi:ATP/maltotriose-dependent transcriptional regulator MalT